MKPEVSSMKSANEKYPRSIELFEQAQQYFVGGLASSLHKAKTDPHPIYIERGKGARVWDIDGNEYIDYVGGFGPLILGYCPEAVDEAVIEQIRRGTVFAAPNELLNQVSQKLIEAVPCAELVAYQSTGTEANMLALRIARAFTGKNKIIRFEGHYHGWSDELLISNAPDSVTMMGPRNKPWRVPGSPGQLPRASEEIIVLPWNDADLVETVLRRQGHEIAAVISEPVMCNCEVVYPQPGYLEALRTLTRDHDVLLIFDEVITGFRLALGGAQEYYGVIPDLAVFGKAMAGGYPLSSVMGKREVMESGVKPRGTFNANPLTIAACAATVTELEKPGVYDRMADTSRSILDGIRKISKTTQNPLYCDGEGSIWQIAFGITGRLTDYRDTFRVDKSTYQKLKQQCFRRGLRLHPFRGRLYTSAAHTPTEAAETVRIIADAYQAIQDEPGTRG
jgi:glutamate-1-semialdehyde 2,1-aminomutase